jgi:multidrug resistance efflux pump
VSTIIIHAQQAYRAAKAVEIKTQLAIESTVDGENTEVAQLQAQLEVAKLNLEWTTVRAPQDGYVVQLALRPGQRVGDTVVRSWLAFVEQQQTRVVAWIKQYQLRHIEPGQSVSVEFKLYPGQTFSATVDAIVGMNAMGQMQATGVVQDPNAESRMEQEYGVILKFDEDAGIDVADLPGGAIGTATVFTDHAKPTHFIRRVEIHMKSWLSYIIP